MRTSAVVAVAAVCCLAVGCGDTATPTAAVPISAPTTSPTGPNQEICSVTDNGGTYYLNVSSGTEHDFRACATGTVYTGTLDTLLAMPGMDRRCILPDKSIAELHALVGVYSSRSKADLQAAKAYCSSHEGTND